VAQKVRCTGVNTTRRQQPAISTAGAPQTMLMPPPQPMLMLMLTLTLTLPQLPMPTLPQLPTLPLPQLLTLTQRLVLTQLPMLVLARSTSKRAAGRAHSVWRCASGCAKPAAPAPSTAASLHLRHRSRRPRLRFVDMPAQWTKDAWVKVRG